MVSLFGSMNVGELALRASSVALQTVGQNIANASNESYHRQRVFMDALPPADRVNFQLGSGVEVERVSRVVDYALQSLIRDAKSDGGYLDVKRDLLGRLEAVFNEFTDADLSSTMSEFFDSLRDLSENVDDISTRSGVIHTAKSLCESFNHLADRIKLTRKEADDRVVAAVTDINRITGEIAKLNKQIALTEDGGLQIQEANDLRDQRDALVEELSGILSIKTNETASGMLQVYTGSEFLVFDANSYEIELDESTDGVIKIHTPRFAKNGLELVPEGGMLLGAIEARDTMLDDYEDALDELAKTVIYEFNRIHTTGRGLMGYTALTSSNSVSDPTAALDASGLPFAVLNGSFNIIVRNETDGTEETTNVKIDLTGTATDTSLADVAAALDAVDDISASVRGDGKLEVTSDYKNITFSFADDSASFLAATGLGGFFTGEKASDVAVAEKVSEDVSYIACAGSAVSGDNSNVINMLALRDANILQNDSANIEEYYSTIVGRLGTDSAAYQNRAENQQVLADQLTNERMAISGVNLDEEAIDMVKYQQAFQAAARFLAAISDMMDILMNI